MKKLSDAIRDFAEIHDGIEAKEGEPNPGWSLHGKELHEASVSWAKHALLTYRGSLLAHALHVSAALANFTAELDKVCDE